MKMSNELLNALKHWNDTGIVIYDTYSDAYYEVDKVVRELGKGIVFTKGKRL